MVGGDDWHQTTGLGSHELVDKVADVIFGGPAAVHAPKILLVEDDVDITDLADVVWAFATRSHPDVNRGEFHYPPQLTDPLTVYLNPEERHSFAAGKVIYNCLFADLFPEGRRPVKGSYRTAGRRRSRSGCSAAGRSTATGSRGVSAALVSGLATFTWTVLV